MASYIDTSFLLAIAQGESGITDLLPLWENDHHRFSSRLLWAECTVTLRRGNADPVQAEAARRLLSGVNALELTKSIVDRLDTDTRFSKCRTLDAIHLATALELAGHAEDLVVISLDRRMRMVASLFSLMVLPREV